MNEYTIDIATAFDKRDEFYDAVAIVKWKTWKAGPCGDSNCCQETVENKWTTSLQRSRDENRAVSFALEEAAAAFKRGDIP